MVRLLLKIFLAYWLAAGIVIATTDLEPHRSIHTPELMDALNGALGMASRTLVQGYEAGRCSSTLAGLNTDKQSLYLADTQGRLLCGTWTNADIPRVIAIAVKQNKRITLNYEWFQMIALPVTGTNGVPYVVLFKSSYSSALHVYGLLPGYTTIAISCFVTLILALLIVLPIRRLRSTAGQIAMGKLDARVRWRWALGTRLWVGEDDIGLLMRDFNYMAERLEQLANAQRILLRDVSHELRSPLTRLSVALSLARPEAHGSMREHLNRIELETEQLNGLIGQILSLSQMEMVDEIRRSDLISLSELIVNVLPDIQYEAAQSNCVICKHLTADCYVRGDAALLKATIENILRNAIKYAPNSGEISIQTTAENRNGGPLVRVAVSDNGPGIPEEELESVLKPFYRADRKRHWQKEGSGVGLAIADRAAHLHGGTISLRNKESGGLVVEVCFPAASIA